MAKQGNEYEKYFSKLIQRGYKEAQKGFRKKEILHDPWPLRLRLLSGQYIYLLYIIGSFHRDDIRQEDLKISALKNYLFYNDLKTEDKQMELRLSNAYEGDVDIEDGIMTTFLGRSVQKWKTN